MLNSRTNDGTNISFISGSTSSYNSIGVGMFKDSSLMGTFTLRPPFNPSKSTPICMISLGAIESQCFSFTSKSILSDILAINHNTWVLPHPSEVESFRESMSLSVVDISYHEIQLAPTDVDQILHHDVEYDKFTFPFWAFNPPHSHDFLDIDFPLYEAILESMNMDSGPWEYIHHLSFFLPKLE
jgi:hypothetical protein